MTRRNKSIEPDYFDAMYEADDDPWRFASSPYEREKYAASLAALGGRRFSAGLEIGCSIGVLTEHLAACCDALLAIDVAEAAIEKARVRCAALPVRFENRRIPADWPAGKYDLIVLSEVLYYLAAPDLVKTAALAASALNPGGVVLLVHYLGETDYPLDGDEAAELFIEASQLDRVVASRAPLYRIDVLKAP